MPKYLRNCADVEYYVPGRKRRVAGSTKATSDFLVLVHQQYPTETIAQLRTRLTDRTQFIFQPEAVAVLDAHIAVGQGNRVPNWR